MDNLNYVLNANITIVVAALLLLIILLLVMLLRAVKKVQVLQEKYDYFTKGTENIDIGELLTETLSEVRTGRIEMEKLSMRCADLKVQLKDCVQKVGVVRFNAFEDTGSDLSYSVALLNENNDGVVLSSIFGRDENRCYAKPIKEGKSEYPLSKEELQALKK
ncbi:DUF4446 family protein [Candidatus Falkowbacteria bacterium]|nr:DUF4446 family protein [Candidatus Falkowbacteria bacterium]